ncbi:hypothetical protein ACFC1R_17595 [Kitasatospora sp. NPDC056138]|uniref:hypothetical protein n=1 Tax=Kitasatospora sp. NPDC056138 TaxID=3345724 RepID=UPI0035DF75DE
MTAAPPRTQARTSVRTPGTPPGRPQVRPGLPEDPAVALPGPDRVEPRRPVALAVLRRPDRPRRPYDPVVARGGPAALPLARGAGEAVPELLHRLGRGAAPGLGLTAGAGGPMPGGRGAAGPRPPRPRGAEDESPRPDRRPAGPQAVWLRRGESGPGLDLCSPDLLRLLDCLADARARDPWGLAPAR